MLTVSRLAAIHCRRIPFLRFQSNLPSLPPFEEWREKFAIQQFNTRVSVANPITAGRLADNFLPAPAKEVDEGKIVIEAYPGPGVLTRTLLSLPPSRLKKLIVLEEVPQYLEYLKVLEEYDPRIIVLPLSGFNWSSYSDIEARGLLDDVVKTPWEKEDVPNLQFISHIPNNVLGDQILSQFFRCIPERSWLFKYGRVPMSLILSQSLWSRNEARIKTKARCKLSVIAEAVADFHEAVPSGSLKPYDEHFHPPTTMVQDRKRSARSIGVAFVAQNIIPKSNPAIEVGAIDRWDYILRRMFVLKSTRLEKAIPSLAPGAANLLTVLTDKTMPADRQVDVSKEIRDLSLEDWAAIVKAFEEWPFAPMDLSVTESIYKLTDR